SRDWSSDVCSSDLAGGARRRRRVPGLPVPGRDPGREQHLLPAQRAQRAAQEPRRAGAGLDAVPEDRAREAGRAEAGRQAAAPRRQRRLLRRREEAQRDLPAGGAGAEAGDPRRDRLGPGHRRAQDRRRGRQRAAFARPGVPGHHPLPAPSGLHQAGRGARARRRPHRRDRRAGAGAAAGRTRLRVDQGPRRPGRGGVMSALLDSLAAGFDGDGARKAALDAVLRDGLPGPRSEAWKYTPLRALERRAFSPAATDGATFDPALIAAIPAPRLVFVNGVHDRAHPDPAVLPDGVSLVLDDTGGPARKGVAQARPGDDVFANLNAALARTGVALRIEAGAEVETPLHLVFIGAPSDTDRAWHLRHAVDVG